MRPMRALAFATVGAAGVLAIASAGDAATFLSFNSQPGDRIGQGQQWTLTPADGSITAIPYAGGVQTHFHSPTTGTEWDLYFIPPSGTAIAPGAYEHVIRYIIEPSVHPALRVESINDCSYGITGRFVVREAVFSGNSLQSFAVDYEQHCLHSIPGDVPALFGSVRFNSAVPTTSVLSVDNVALYEGDSGNVNAGFTVSLSAPSTSSVTVQYATADGSATAGQDYQTTSGTLTFPSGTTARGVDVPVFGNTALGVTRTFALNLSGASGAAIANAQGIGTILDDDGQRTYLYLDRPQQPNGPRIQETLTPLDGTFQAYRPYTANPSFVHVHYSGDQFLPWDLEFAAPPSTPLVPGIYEGAVAIGHQGVAHPGLEVINGGGGCDGPARFVVLELVTVGDTIQSFAADFEQACGGLPYFGSIRFNSAVSRTPRLSVNSIRVYEGDVGTADAAFTVSLSSPSVNSVTVPYATSDGTAVAGTDYLTTTGTVILPAGVTHQTVTVPILGNTTAADGSRTFSLNLGSPSGAPVVYGSGTGTIVDDEGPRTFISVNSEPGDWAGQGLQRTLTPLDGTITAGAVGGGVHVHFEGDNNLDLDFMPAQSGTLAPGSYVDDADSSFATAQQPALFVHGYHCDSTKGRFTVYDVSFALDGSVSSFAADFEQHCDGSDAAWFGSVRYAYVIPAAPVALSVSDRAVTEGDAAVKTAQFVVSLSSPVAALVTVDYATADSSAVSGVDFTATAGTLTFKPGETVKWISVPILGDTTLELDKTFDVTLSNAVGATIARAVASGTIRNDDTHFLDRQTIRLAAVKNGTTLTSITTVPSINVTLDSNVSWTASSNQAFVSVSPASGSGKQTLTLQVDPIGLPATGYAPATTITVVAAGVTNDVVVFIDVYAPGTTAAPFGFLDTPADGLGGVQGATPITGWSLDDIGIDRVEIWRDPVNGDPPPAANGKVFIGRGTFVSGARPDVASQFWTYPEAGRAGWGYMLLTNMLPNPNTGAPVGGVGTFKLYAYAVDMEGHSTLLGTRTFTCDNTAGNKPFGTIDTPAQGQTVSGKLDSFGWVLTPLPAAIPTDGSTITLFIDGMPQGTVLYNLPRNDVSTLFPGYANTSGPVGYFAVDTTKLANGVHTIFWVVTDDMARGEGIGSRYFTVLN
jgi:hypothetical protein